MEIELIAPRSLEVSYVSFGRQFDIRAGVGNEKKYEEKEKRETKEGNLQETKCATRSHLD
jgi:hypothetical protein